jgi:hypothetical protein
VESPGQLEGFEARVRAVEAGAGAEWGRADMVRWLHLVEEDELWEGMRRVGVEVDVFGVAYIEDGRLRAFDSPGKDRERGGKGLCGDGREVGDKELDGSEDGVGGRGLRHQGEDLGSVCDEREVSKSVLSGEAGCEGFRLNHEVC